MGEWRRTRGRWGWWGWWGRWVWGSLLVDGADVAPLTDLSVLRAVTTFKQAAGCLLGRGSTEQGTEGTEGQRDRGTEGLTIPASCSRDPGSLPPSSALRFNDHTSRPDHSARRRRRRRPWHSAEWDNGRRNQCHNKSTTARATNQATRRTRSSTRPRSEGRWYLECVSAADISLWLSGSSLASCCSSYIRTAHTPHNYRIYTLNIAVGTPQVSFPVLVDTGSSDFVRLLGATFDQLSHIDQYWPTVDRKYLVRNLGMQTIWADTVESRGFLNPSRIKSQRPAPVPSGQRQWSRVLGYYHHRRLPDP